MIICWTAMNQANVLHRSFRNIFEDTLRYDSVWLPIFKSPNYGSQHSGSPKTFASTSHPIHCIDRRNFPGLVAAPLLRQWGAVGCRQHSEQRFCRFCGSSVLQSSDSSHVQDFDAQFVAQVRTSNAPKNVKQHKQRPKLLPPVGPGYSIFSDTFLCLFCQAVLWPSDFSYQRQWINMAANRFVRLFVIVAKLAQNVLHTSFNGSKPCGLVGHDCFNMF